MKNPQKHYEVYKACLTMIGREYDKSRKPNENEEIFSYLYNEKILAYKRLSCFVICDIEKKTDKKTAYAAAKRYEEMMVSEEEEAVAEIMKYIEENNVTGAH